MSCRPTAVAHVELLNKLPRPYLTRLCAELTEFEHRPGETIFRAGDRTRDVYFLLSGSLSISITAANGREIVVGKVEAGGVFGEYAAIDSAPRSASVNALTLARTVRMGAEHFLRMLAEFPQLNLWVTNNLISEIRDIYVRIAQRSSITAEGRIYAELLQLAKRHAAGDPPELEPPPTHAVLASLAGTQREAVTRAMGKLIDAGVIEANRQRIRFLDLRTLTQLCQLGLQS